MNLSDKNVGFICNTPSEFFLIEDILRTKNFKRNPCQKHLNLVLNNFPLIVFINLPWKRNNMLIASYEEFKKDNTNPDNYLNVIHLYHAKSLFRKTKLENIENQ